jgi:hypothetical protein
MENNIHASYLWFTKPHCLWLILVMANGEPLSTEEENDETQTLVLPNTKQACYRCNATFSCMKTACHNHKSVSLIKIKLER